jgi:hypothetical protein
LCHRLAAKIILQVRLIQCQASILLRARSYGYPIPRQLSGKTYT